MAQMQGSGGERISVAAVVLAGGESRRMGTPKAWLPFDDGTLLTRVAGILEPLVSEVVVVAAPGQALPRVSARRVEDEYPGAGPLGGLYSGLRAITQPAALVVSCDAPFLRPPLLRLLVWGLAEYQLAVAEWDGRRQPLPGVYARSLVESLEERIRRGDLRLSALAETHPTYLLREDAVRAVDPEGASFLNINTPEEYAAALRRLRPTSGSPITPNREERER